MTPRTLVQRSPIRPSERYLQHSAATTRSPWSHTSTKNWSPPIRNVFSATAATSTCTTSSGVLARPVSREATTSLTQGPPHYVGLLSRPSERASTEVRASRIQRSRVSASAHARGGDCASACAYYLQCNCADSQDNRAVCNQECAAQGYTAQQLSDVQQLDCATAVCTIERMCGGSSGVASSGGTRGDAPTAHTMARRVSIRGTAVRADHERTSAWSGPPPHETRWDARRLRRPR